MAETQEAPRQLSTSELAVMLSNARQEIASAKEAKKNLAGRNEFMRGAVRATDQLQASYQGGVGLVNSLLGNDAEAARRFSNYKDEMRQSTENPATVDKFFSSDPKSGAMASVGNMGTWVAGTAGSLIPSVAESALSGVAGGVVGGMLVPGPDPADVATVPIGAIAGMFSKGAVRSAIAKASEQYIKQGIKREAAKQMATQAVRNTIAKRAGAATAAQQTTAWNEGGSMYMEGREKGYDNPYSALALGQVSGASEVAFGIFPSGVRMLLGRSDVLEKAKKEGWKAAAGYAWDLGKNSFQEGGQEGFQEWLGILNEGINDPSAHILTKENFMKVAEASAAGALGGTAFGAAEVAQSAYRDSGRQPPPPPPETGDTVSQNEPLQSLLDKEDASDQSDVVATTTASEVDSTATQDTSESVLPPTQDAQIDTVMDGLSPEDIQRLGNLESPPTGLSPRKWSIAVTGDWSRFPEAPEDDAVRIQQWERARAAKEANQADQGQVVSEGVSPTEEDAEAAYADTVARLRASESQQAEIDWNGIAKAANEVFDSKAKEEAWTDEELATTKNDVANLVKGAVQGDEKSRAELIGIAKNLEEAKQSAPPAPVAQPEIRDRVSPVQEEQPSKPQEQASSGDTFMEYANAWNEASAKRRNVPAKPLSESNIKSLKDMVGGLADEAIKKGRSVKFASDNPVLDDLQMREVQNAVRAKGYDVGDITRTKESGVENIGFDITGKAAKSQSAKRPVRKDQQAPESKSRDSVSQMPVSEPEVQKTPEKKWNRDDRVFVQGHTTASGEKIPDSVGEVVKVNADNVVVQLDGESGNKYRAVPKDKLQLPDAKFIEGEKVGIPWSGEKYGEVTEVLPDGTYKVAVAGRQMSQTADRMVKLPAAEVKAKPTGDTVSPVEQAPAVDAIGERMKIMNTPVVRSGIFTDEDNIRHEMFESDDGKSGIVRSTDVDSGNVVSAKKYPSVNAAKNAFDKVQGSRGQSQPTAQPAIAPAKLPPQENQQTLEAKFRDTVSQKSERNQEAKDASKIEKGGDISGKVETEGQTKAQAKTQTDADGRKGLLSSKEEQAAEREPSPASSAIDFYKKDSQLAALYESDSGVSEGLTVEQHTRQVADNWGKQITDEELAALSKSTGIELGELMKDVVALHDIGKPIAIKKGRKSLQHSETIPILRAKLEERGFSKPQVDLAIALVGNDVIGGLLKAEKPDVRVAYNNLVTLSQQANVTLKDFFKLATYFFKADAGSYPNLRNSIFIEGMNGKLLLPDVTFGILEERIYGNVFEAAWNERVGEKGKGLESLGDNRGAVEGKYVHGTAVQFKQYEESKDSGKNLFGKGLYLVNELDADVAAYYATRAVKKMLATAGFTPKQIETIFNKSVEDLRFHASKLREISSELEATNKAEAKRYATAAEIVDEIINGRVGKHVLPVKYDVKNVFEMGAIESKGRFITDEERNAIISAAPVELRDKVRRAIGGNRRAIEVYNSISKALGSRDRTNAILISAGYDSIQFVHYSGNYTRPYNVTVVIKAFDSVSIGKPTKPSALDSQTGSSLDSVTDSVKNVLVKDMSKKQDAKPANDVPTSPKDAPESKKPAVSEEELRQSILDAMIGERKAPAKKAPKKPAAKPKKYSPPKEPSETKKAVQNKKQEATKDYDEAKQRFRDAFNKAKGTNLSNAPLTPEYIELLAATADLMVQGIRVKAWSFAEIVADLAETFGRENIPSMREYLERGWNAAVEIEGVKPANYDKVFNDLKLVDSTAGNVTDVPGDAVVDNAAVQMHYPDGSAYRNWMNRKHRIGDTPTSWLSGHSSDKVREAAKDNPGLGLVITPATKQYIKHGGDYSHIMVDNGAFSEFTGTSPFSEDKFFAMLDAIVAAGLQDKVQHVVVPDKVGDWKGTTERWREFYERVKAYGMPLAYVGQDGIEEHADQIPWDDFDVFFIGGSTPWKLGYNPKGEYKDFNRPTDAELRKAGYLQAQGELIKEARRRGKRVHMGRVNSWKRMEMANYGIQVDSADGNFIGAAPDNNLPIVVNWLNGTGGEQFAPVESGSKQLDKEGDVEKTLRQAGLKVEQLPDKTWKITGNTYEHSKEIGDVKREIPELGGWFNAKTKQSPANWTFRGDPRRAIVDRIAGKGDGDGPVADDGSTEQMAREEARRRENERPDERRTSGAYAANVDKSTKGLIERGIKFGMTREVVDNQIEDIGMVVDAAENDRKMFVVGSAPGTGKTFVLGGVIRELRSRGFKKFIYVTQNENLIDQIKGNDQGVKGNLEDYGLEGVEFRTYAKLRTAPLDATGAVLLLDEAHTAKNTDRATGEAISGMVSNATFTVYASATPFENVTEAEYFKSSKIFDDVATVEIVRPSKNPKKPFRNELHGFEAWAWMFGAEVMFLPKKTKWGETYILPILKWNKHTTAEDDQLAANEWLKKRGIYVQRPMSLPTGTVNSELRSIDADPYWADISNEVVQIYDDAENEAESNTEKGQIRAHKKTTLKRLLELSKVDAAIARAKEIIGEGGKDDPQVILFVNYKKELNLGSFALSKPYREHRGIKGKEATRQYAPDEMDRMMQGWYEARAAAERMGESKSDVGPPPFAPFIHKIAMVMHKNKLLEKFDSVIDKIMAEFPGKSVEFSGRMSPEENAKNLAAWKNNEAKVIVATMDKGGTGLSFHDTTGTMPSRYQVNMNLPWSGTKVEQVSGRLARYGTAKSVNLEWLFANNIPFDRELSKTVGSRMRSMSAAVQGRKSGEAKQIRDFDFEVPVEMDAAAERQYQADRMPIIGKAMQEEKTWYQTQDESLDDKIQAWLDGGELPTRVYGNSSGVPMDLGNGAAARKRAQSLANKLGVGVAIVQHTKTFKAFFVELPVSSVEGKIYGSQVPLDFNKDFESVGAVAPDAGKEKKTNLDKINDELLGITTEKIKNDLIAKAAEDLGSEVQPKQSEVKDETRDQEDEERPDTGTVGQDRGAISGYGVKGKSTSVITADGKTRKATYYAVEAESLVPSHDARNKFTKNIGALENERPYHDPKQGADSRRTVEAIAEAQPEKLPLLTSDTNSPIDGPPIVDQTGVVLGGNARSMGMQLAYFGDQASRLKEHVRSQGSKFGIPQGSLDGLKEPVIVRVLYEEFDRSTISSLLNESLAASKSQATVSVSQAKRISEGTISLISNILSSDASPSLREAMAEPRHSDRIVKALVSDGAWSSRETDLYVNPVTGDLNADGKSAIENLLVARVIPDVTVLGDAAPSVKQKLLSAIGPLAKGMDDEKHGKQLLDSVLSAVKAYDGYVAEKRIGQSLQSYFMDQGRLFEVPGYKDYVAASFVHALAEFSPTKFRVAVNDVISSLGIGERTLSLFDDMNTTYESLEDAVKNVINPPLMTTPGTLFQLEKDVRNVAGSLQGKDVDSSVREQIVKLAIAAEKAGVKTFDELVAHFVDSIGEKRTRELGAGLRIAAKVMGFKGVRQTSDVLGRPDVTREEVIQLAKGTFTRFSDEQIETAIKLQDITLFGRTQIGFAPAGSPVPGSSLLQSQARQHLASEQPSTYRTIDESEVPKNTRRAYKLMKRYKSRPGLLFPLFVKAEEGSFRKGEWYAAEIKSPRISSKDLARRPGIHSVDLPIFAQGKPSAKGQDRVWVEVEIPEITPETQAESDSSERLPNGMRTGITQRLIGTKEAYDYKTNPNAAGANAWPIAGSMKIIRVLSDADVADVLRNAGKEEWVDASLSGESIEAADRWNSLYQQESIGESYFAPDAIAKARDEANEYKSRTTIIEMTPDQFLDMAERLGSKGAAEISQEKTNTVAGVLSRGEKFSSIPHLSYEIDRETGDATVVGHEGRHRAMALKKLGVKSMPVTFRGPIRWDQQEDKAGFDRVKKWPKTLKGETEGEMPFPVLDPLSQPILMQQQQKNGNVKGWTQFISATRAIVGATDKADFSTFIHEFFHPMRRFLLDKSIAPEQRAGITNTDIESLEKAVGAGKWKGDKWVSGKWKTEHEEKAAKLWEQYWLEGKAPPNRGLEGLFQKISIWMQEVYKGIQQITGGPLPDDVRKLFDKLVQRGGGEKIRDSVLQIADSEPTSIKNEVANELRAQRGVPALADVASQTKQEWLDAADSMLQDDPMLGDRLVKELNANARNLSNIEVAVMQIHYRQLNNQLVKASDKLFAAKDKKDSVASAQAMLNTDIIMNALVEMEEATKKAGREWGRAGVARQIELEKDFSLAALLRKARIANAGNALNEKQMEEIRLLSAKVAKLEGELAKANQIKLDLERMLNTERSIKEEKDRVGPPAPKSSVRQKAANKIVDFAKKFTNLFVARPEKSDTLHQTEEELMIEEAESVVQAYVDSGIYSFGVFVANIKKDLGSDIPSQAIVAFETAWKNIKSQGNIPSPTVDRTNARGMTRFVRSIQRSLVESGITKPKEVVVAVQDALKEMGIELEEREVMDALSGYGQYSPPSDNELDKIIADINGQLLELAKLDDMKNKIAPAKTGVGRQELSPEHRELIRKVNIAKREGDYRVTDPDTQLKSAVGAAKTALTNRIYDLDKAINVTKQPIAGSEKKDLAGKDEGVIALRKKRDELMKEYRALFPKPGATMEQRIAATNSVLDRVIADLQKQLDTGNFESKKKSEPISTKELDAKRAHIEALRAQRAATDGFKEWNDEQKSKAYKANLLKKIAEYQDMALNNYFDPKPKKEARELSKEELALKMELQNAKDIFFRLAGLYRLQNMSPRERAWDYVKETAHLSRALMTSFDFSAVFRQGGTIAFAHPKMAKETSMEMYKVMWSEAETFKLAEKIRSDDMYQFAITAGLSITEEEGKITKQEEAYMGRWARLGIGEPGTKLSSVSKALLFPVSASARGYMAFLNGLRFKLFKQMVANLGKGGQVNADEAKVIAMYINAATGRSDLGPMMRWAEQMNMLFFAPRFVASRFQYLGMPLWLLGSRKVSGRVKKAIAMEYIRHATGIGAFLATTVALGALLGGDDEEEKPTVSLDPRSSDFLKIKFGETRIDPMSGLSQVIVLMGRIASGQRVGADGEVVNLRGEDVPYGGLGVAGTAGNFVRTKFAPIPGAAFDIATGENVVGQPVTPFSSLVNLFIPLSLREIKDTAESRGIPQGAVLTILSLHGMGASTYGPESNYRKGTAEQREKQFDKDLKKMTFDSKEPAYKGMLTKEQMSQMNERREGRKQGLVYAASSNPIRKVFKNDDSYSQAVKERDVALENLKKSGLSLDESRGLLIKHWESNYGSAKEVRGGVRVYKEALSDRLKQLRKVYAE